MDQCACCGAYGVPMKTVGLVKMCVDHLGCERRKAARDDDDRFLITPLEGPPDPNAPHVTVDCARRDCRMSFFVAKDDPRLPDGPFLCHDHSDTPPKFEIGGHVEATVFCDRCDAKIVVEAPTRPEAMAKLREKIAEQNWRCVDRLGALEAAATLTGAATSTSPTAPDLCDACAKKL